MRESAPAHFLATEAPMRHTLRTEIEIEARPDAVWAVLTDLPGYVEWNPFVVSAEGAVAVGERLTNRLQPPGGKSMTFRPRVTVVEPGRTFEWLGHLGFPGVFDGRHRFDLETTPTGTRLVQSEEFRGLLVPFMRGSLESRTRLGFDGMNAALKAKVESNEAEEPVRAPA